MRPGSSWTRWAVTLALLGCSTDDDGGDTTSTTATGASSADDGGDDGSGADGADDGGSTAGEGSGGSGGTADDTGGSTGSVMCEYVDPGEAGCPKGTAQCNDVGPSFNCAAIELVDACCGCERPDCPG